jgi:hypothetical protein
MHRGLTGCGLGVHTRRRLTTVADEAPARFTSVRAQPLNLNSELVDC